MTPQQQDGYAPAVAALEDRAVAELERELAAIDRQLAADEQAFRDEAALLFKRERAVLAGRTGGLRGKRAKSKATDGTGKVTTELVVEQAADRSTVAARLSEVGQKALARAVELAKIRREATEVALHRADRKRMRGAHH